MTKSFCAQTSSSQHYHRVCDPWRRTLAQCPCQPRVVDVQFDVQYPKFGVDQTLWGPQKGCFDHTLIFCLKQAFLAPNAPHNLRDVVFNVRKFCKPIQTIQFGFSICKCCLKCQISRGPGSQTGFDSQRPTHDTGVMGAHRIIRTPSKPPGKVGHLGHMIIL